MTTGIKAFREWKNEYQLVGHLVLGQDGTKFRYDEKYICQADSAPISESLPFPPFSGKDVFPSDSLYPRALEQSTFFFKGLLPEEGMKKSFEHKFHSSAIDEDALITRLNNESVGALVFGNSAADLRKSRFYEPLPEDYFIRFAKNPREVALESASQSRLSLAGAQSKVGLYCKVDDSRKKRWFLPKGSAPSTVIVKAGSFIDSLLPNSIFNEAFCMKVAEKCHFETAETKLLEVPEASPLLLIKRFDRLEGSDFPTRLHQEDFCQALGYSPAIKYEPNSGNYINQAAYIINRVSDNPFGDRAAFFQEILFDFLIGNCDNHLKNFSFIWSSDWRSRTLSPLYDVNCTTIYPFDREMGISLCASRKIDDVTMEDIKDSAQQAGIPFRIARSLFDELVETIKEASNTALEELLAQCTKQETAADLEKTAEIIMEDMKQRISIHE